MGIRIKLGLPGVGEQNEQEQKRIDRERAQQAWIMQQMQAQMETELDPEAREARIRRQQQFMKWRLGGKEEAADDEEFKEMEQEEERSSWKKGGWRDWKADN